jgi:CDP-diacylglycerol--glycerol-3-phosphate 3-phosphatidyltransferase
MRARAGFLLAWPANREVRMSSGAEPGRANPPLLTVPNLLSGLRLLLAPLLLYFAWVGQPTAFLVALACSLLSDLFDGYFARRFDQATPLGTLLDSYGDLATYLTVPLCAWWLWPDLIRREAWYAAAIVCAYTFPIGLGYLKYGRLTSYHTYGAKLSAVVMGGSALLLFAGGPPHPFRIGTWVLVLAELEEIAITTLLPEWRANVPSLLHARRLLREPALRGPADGS